MFFCLRIVKYSSPSSAFISCLVLQRPSTVEGAYERVGVGVFILRDDNDHQSFHSFDDPEIITLKIV